MSTTSKTPDKVTPPSRSQIARANAQFQRELSANLIEEINRNALLLAPTFRHKFDFSEPKHFEAWADLSWQGANAMLERKLKAIAAANKEFDAAIEKADSEQLKEGKA